MVSGEFGWLKPHPDIYRQALGQIGARAQETVFVGDDLDNDVVAPKALGCERMVHNAGGDLRARGHQDFRSQGVASLVGAALDMTSAAGAIGLETRLLVDGKFIESASGKSFDVVSPLRQLYAKVARADAQDVDAAATAARRAFDQGPWPKMAPFERGGILRSIADAIRGDASTIAVVETRCGGKTLANSRNEVEAAARVFDYYAGAMDKFFGETIPMGDGVLDFTLREPVGVVAQITPWNFPFLAAAWKVAPALATVTRLS